MTYLLIASEELSPDPSARDPLPVAGEGEVGRGVVSVARQLHVDGAGLHVPDAGVLKREYTE